MACLQAGPQCVSAGAKGHTHTAVRPLLKAVMVFSHHFFVREERLSPQRNPTFPSTLEKPHSGSVILTPSGGKNAMSLPNLVPLLDRIDSGGGMKKPGRTIFFLSIWTSGEPELVWEL